MPTDNIILSLCGELVDREERLRYEYGSEHDFICAPDCQKHSDSAEAVKCWYEYYTTGRKEKREKAEAEHQEKEHAEYLIESAAREKYYQEHPECRPPAPPLHHNCRCFTIPIAGEQHAN